MRKAEREVAYSIIFILNFLPLIDNMIKSLLESHKAVERT
jgi:hypothetical protein